MTEVATHPAFEAAPAEKRWYARASFLFGTLSAEATSSPTREADRALDGGWWWRVFQDGVVVGMRTVGKPVHGLYRMELRIAADAGMVEWDGRLAELICELGIRVSRGERPSPYMGALWRALPPAARDEGKLVARYASLAPGESAPPPTEDS